MENTKMEKLKKKFGGNFEEINENNENINKRFFANGSVMVKAMVDRDEYNREKTYANLNPRPPGMLEFKKAKEITIDGIKYGCVVIEFFNGRTLEDRISKEVDLNFVKTIINQIIDLLIVFKERKIIHCDINPRNILVNDQNEMKLIDFGCVRNFNEINDQTLINGRNITIRRDIEDLGILFQNSIKNREDLNVFSKFPSRCLDRNITLYDLEKFLVGKGLRDQVVSHPVHVSADTPRVTNRNRKSSISIIKWLMVLFLIGFYSLIGRIDIPKSEPPYVNLKEVFVMKPLSAKIVDGKHYITIPKDFYKSKNIDGELADISGQQKIVTFFSKFYSISDGFAFLFGGYIRDSKCPCCGHRNLRVQWHGLLKRFFKCECNHKTNNFCKCGIQGPSETFFGGSHDRHYHHHQAYQTKCEHGVGAYLYYGDFSWTYTCGNKTEILEHSPVILTE
ncbi:hypothetical protein DICPUDRAFT_77467 [Dictyostelium purpureum]|uniref:non-specific serine/threonine protein kinase n=1 Tax=Dictyostelium purpureum TaxID=5786 RepID=F0ZGP6_DICPU|nr:uncharacterized protein DICPUDRAFT_77467 [Dictyostelium purpureum]EGC36882.1 hypothetical protein DICPUDRAFT_77467 [Dictyostelium purpureum]|eukprot:XP_003286604.1 hypothetical protein DICPUDRAFT_77467 [Dictyostelium purpureum]